ATHKSLTDAGITRIVLVTYGPDANGDAPDPLVLVNVNAGTDREAVRTAFSKVMDTFETTSINDSWAMFRVRRNADQPIPPADPQQKQRLQASLQSAGDGAIVAALVPSDMLQQVMKPQHLPPGFSGLAQTIVNSESANLAL